MIRALVLAIGILLPIAVNAEGTNSPFPFGQKVRQFKEYINKMGEQRNGSTYEYLELRECRDSSVYTPTVSCYSVDYIETNRLGTRTCVNSNIRYYPPKTGGGESIDRYGGTCGPYRQVSSYRTPTTTSKIKGSNLNPTKDIMIGGGFLIFAAGFGMGLAVSGLRKQRTETTKPEKSDKEGDKE